MAIPNFLTSTENWKVGINQDFINFNEFKNWTPERQIEALRKLVKEYVYWNSVLPEKKIDKSMQAFNWAYWLAKLKFQNIKRNTWWRYFDHLIRVMQYIVKNSKTPNIKKTIMSICHDLIEDTDISFSTLKEIFWTHIALWILLISKKPIKDFINTKSDFDLFEDIEKSWILNFKWLLWDEFLQRKTYFPENITFEEKNAENLFEKFEKKYKYIRSVDYFSHMLSETWDIHKNYDKKISNKTPCLNNFYNHALEVASNPNLKVRLDEDEIRNICFDALEVKFWDRIDNLETTEIYHKFNILNVKKAKRKIEETKSYFYSISKEFDEIEWTKFYEIISLKVETLEKYILDNKYQIVWEEVKNRVWNLVK